MKARPDRDETLERLLTRLSSLPDTASRKRYIERHPQVVHAKIVEQLAEAVRRDVRVDMERALALAEIAVVIAEELHNEEAFARALRAKANALWFKGQCKPAIELLDHATKLFEKAGNISEVGRTLSTSIQPLTLLGDYEHALSVAEHARTIFKKTGEDSRLARLEINIANVLHRRDQLAEALACYERAYKQLLPYKDAEGIGVALHNMAICLIGLNDFHHALKTYQNARQFCRDHGMPLLAAQADYNIAYLYYLRGDYNRALELLRKTREACHVNNDVYHWALCNLDQSEIYLELNLIEEAEELAQKASDQFERLGLGYEYLRSLTNLAVAMSQKGQRAAALRLFAQARRKATAEKNPVWPRIIDLYRALLLVDDGQPSRSMRLATNSLSFFSSHRLPGKAAICHLLLARCALRQDDLEAAHNHCLGALEELTGVEAPMLSYQTHLLTGQVQEAKQDLPSAHQSYQEARLALETLRGSLGGEELKIAFMKDRGEVYERLIQLCLNRRPDPAAAEDAFTYMEQGKCRTLRDLMLGGFPTIMDTDIETARLERRLRDLREELNWYYHRIESEQLSRETIRPETIERLRVDARSRENELQRLLLELHSVGTVDAKLRISTAVTIEQIRAALGSESMLVEYFVVRSRIVAAILTRDDLEIFTLCPISTITQRLRLLQFQLSRVPSHLKPAAIVEKTLLQTTQTHLQALYGELVAPFRHKLEARHVVFVPHDLLHYLPFHALFDGKDYLLDSFTISYAPSATIYALCHTRSANQAGPALVLGVPDALAPHILQEVRSVAAAVSDPEVYIGPKATMDVLKKSGPRSFMVHIATHGYFRQDNPLFSSIRLGSSYLSLHDFYELHLPVQLLALSGCATGLNAVTAGDELLGLIRGLLYAGAQSLLLTLWDVHDTTTAKLMESFYRRLQQKIGKADALKAAMLEARDARPHPYYWAPFVLVGKVLPS